MAIKGGPAGTTAMITTRAPPAALVITIADPIDVDLTLTPDMAPTLACHC